MTAGICWGYINDVNAFKLLATLVTVAVASMYSLVYLLSHTPREPFSEELQSITVDENGDRLTTELVAVNSATHHASEGILLSVVVPSYNETGRILLMLTEAIKYLESAFPQKWEIIIVDDGSRDGTTDYCLKQAHEQFKLRAGELRVIHFIKNRGKGGAVRQGMLHIRGKYGLFADADGASKFSDVEKLLESVKKLEKNETGKDKAAVAIGSRAHMINTDALVKRSVIRNFLMYGLHTLVFVFGIRSIKDTQCGFKLFNKAAIEQIFPYLHTEGWIFDVEILMLAIRKLIPIVEVPISWHEVDGSKMELARDSINMAKDLVVIRMAYILGIYKDYRKI